MNSLKLAWWTSWRTLRSRLGAVLITLLAVSLATATALVVPLVTTQVESGAQDAAQVFDLLIAAPGSRTQAVMSSLFYLDIPTGNMPLSVYQNLRDDPTTARAVPLGFGDNYMGFPVVGTNAQFFEQRLAMNAAPYFQLASGQVFKQPYQAVLGAKVAQETGLTIGDTFVGAHGITDEAALEAEWAANEGTSTGLSQAELWADEQPSRSHTEEHEEEEHAEEHEHEEHEYEEHEHEEHEHEEHESALHHDHSHPYTVTGIMQATGGPADRAILTPIESLWQTHDQVGSQREVTAILYAAKDLAKVYSTAGRINNGSDAMAVFPGEVFAQASDTLNQGRAAYTALGILVLGIAALTVWLSVYTSGLERQRNVALLRTLGASRSAVFTLVLLETLLTVTLGTLLGIALAWLLATVGGRVLGAELGFTLPAPELTWALVWRAIALIPLGAVAALPPAIRAARRSPLEHL